MKARLIAISAFNIIDIIATLTVTRIFGFVELNPVMRILLYSPFAFAVVKCGVVSLLLLWLWRKRAERLARVASWVAFTMYVAIALYYAIMFLLMSR